jgi:DNA-binding transcriptional LysR family regulator
MAASHPLAGAAELAFADLADEPFLTQRADNNPRYRRRWLEEQRSHGLEGRIVHEVSEAEELFALLSAGREVCLVPATLAGYHARPGITYVPVRDAASVPIALAWRLGPEQPLLERMISVARSVAGDLLAEPGQTTWLPATSERATVGR